MARRHESVLPILQAALRPRIDERRQRAPASTARFLDVVGVGLELVVKRAHEVVRINRQKSSVAALSACRSI